MVAVERVVLRHLEQQLAELELADPNAAAAISAIVSDEREHHDRCAAHARAGKFWSNVALKILHWTADAFDG